MKKVIKQVLGIDVAQKELVTCLGKLDEDFELNLYAHKTFANTAQGFELLVQWVKKQTAQSVVVRYVMEATGVYHESLAYFLKNKDMEVSIVLPNKISNYARSLTTKTVTDKTASEAIAQFGLERKLDSWEKPSPVFKKIKQLTRTLRWHVYIKDLGKSKKKYDTCLGDGSPWGICIGETAEMLES